MDLPQFVGLDIGSSSIRVAQVEYNGGKPDVTALGHTILDTPIINVNDPGTKQYVVQKIKDALKDAGVKTDKAVAALPEAMIFSKLATVPNLEEDKLDQMLYYELKNHIPVDPGDVQKDYIYLGQDTENPKLMKILIIAAPKVLVDVYRSIAEESKLSLIALETETVALARLSGFVVDSQKSVLIADFGFKGVDLCLVKGGKILFSQSIGTGSDSLTRAISIDLNITHEQAESFKMKMGLMPNEQEGKVLRTLTPIMHIITNEITKLINYFSSTLPDFNPKSIYFLGEGANIPGFIDYMTQNLPIECAMLDLSKGISIQADVKKKFPEASMLGFGVAIGLALKKE